jgi:heme-degrading monooxygenase HmoA
VFVRIWRFCAAAGREERFEAVYGSDGAWAQLFALAPGYLGTELRRTDDDRATYLIIDRWKSRAAWRAFRRDHAAAYDALDRECEPLSVSAELVGERDGAPS